jgi:septal ring factor EnvC (AmiA/AmiB activator)
MSQDEFTKLFKYMEKKFGGIDKRFDKVEGDIRDLKLEMAEFGGQIKDVREELAALSHNDTRQNRWIQELADHTGAKLSPA